MASVFIHADEVVRIPRRPHTRSRESPDMSAGGSSSDKWLDWSKRPLGWTASLPGNVFNASIGEEKKVQSIGIFSNAAAWMHRGSTVTPVGSLHKFQLSGKSAAEYASTQRLRSDIESGRVSPVH